MKKLINYLKNIKNDDILSNNSVKFTHHSDYDFNKIKRNVKSSILLSKIIRFKSSRFPSKKTFEVFPKNLQYNKFWNKFLNRHSASTSDLNRRNIFNNFNANSNYYNITNNKIYHHKYHKSGIDFNTYKNMVFTTFKNKNKSSLIKQVNQMRKIFNLLQQHSSKEINEENKNIILKNYFDKWIYNFKKERRKISEKIINFSTPFQNGTTKNYDSFNTRKNLCNNNLLNINNIGIINNISNIGNSKSTPKYFNTYFNDRYITLCNNQNSSPNYMINNSSNNNNFYYNILIQRNNSYNNITKSSSINLKTLNNCLNSPKVIYQRKIIRAPNTSNYNSNNTSVNNISNHYFNLNNKKNITNNISNSCSGLMYEDPNQSINIYDKCNCLNTDIMNNNNSFCSAPLNKSANPKANLQTFYNSFINKKNYGEEKYEYKKPDKIEEREIKFSQKKYNKKSDNEVDSQNRLSEYNKKKSCLNKIKNTLYEKTNDINRTKGYIMIDENQDYSNTTIEITDNSNKFIYYNKNNNKLLKI